MINKQKMGLTGAKAGTTNSQINRPTTGQFGGGPDNYDGRANTNAGTPPPQQNYFDTPGAQIKTDTD
jgi:hypothetical protein